MKPLIAAALIVSMSSAGSARELAPLSARATVPASGGLAPFCIFPPAVAYHPPRPKTTLQSIVRDVSLIVFFVLITPRSK